MGGNQEEILKRLAYLEKEIKILKAQQAEFMEKPVPVAMERKQEKPVPVAVERKQAKPLNLPCFAGRSSR